jgi:hypothetical protein
MSIGVAWGVIVMPLPPANPRQQAIRWQRLQRWSHVDRPERVERRGPPDQTSADPGIRLVRGKP